jgi:hypothetical protein
MTTDCGAGQSDNTGYAAFDGRDRSEASARLTLSTTWNRAIIAAFKPCCVNYSDKRIFLVACPVVGQSGHRLAGGTALARRS